MDIKEIALRIGEEADDYADAKLQSKGEFHPDWHTVRDEYFAEALISAYKDELLKEVGEPVGYHYLPNNEMFPVEEVSRSNLKNNPQDYVFLYTSYQLAAAQEQIQRMKRERLRTADAIESMHASHKEQLAKAEQQAKELSDSVAQKVADACADLLVDRFKHEVAGTLAIRAGEWRKFVKEV